ncbi:sugar ABC transporter permease [Anaerotalea alkaliphila]|uniref:Xylose transport system permease protein XylH n=1 Tax=Anaerotalea alkaliphila TaxID=2662126 RepID=A0A7X5HV07_9FIRM|nr:sugar ABC transporter permease [Anaerotalea alkaliphila]NDL67150.1 sugar ABC transporter permease [Anaerotalea alkaliphila]
MFKNITGAIKENIRDYGMYIALALIMFIFTTLTDGLFMNPRVISDLIDMTGYIAVLSVGVTLVIIIRHIDLSVGYVSGFLGAVAAILSSRFNMPLPLIIVLVLLLGATVGLLWTGILVAHVKIPAFVATLAAMTIFRGFLIQITKSETIFTNNDAFNAIGNGYIPDIFQGQGLHLTSLLLGMVAIALYFVLEVKNRRKQQEFGLFVSALPAFLAKLAFVAVVVMYFVWKLASFKGFSYTAVIVGVVVVVYNFVTKNTTLGRHIYAVGGNPEAAELSGISVKFITLVVFGSMGMLAGLSGLLFTARLQSATPTAGMGFELDAIAGAFVGGTSASGGVGKVTGSIIGALVMASLSKGMDLMNVGVSYQYIIRGLVLAAAVVFDVKTRNMRAKSA